MASKNEIKLIVVIGTGLYGFLAVDHISWGEWLPGLLCLAMTWLVIGIGCWQLGHRTAQEEYEEAVKDLQRKTLENLKTVDGILEDFHRQVEASKKQGEEEHVEL